MSKKDEVVEHFSAQLWSEFEAATKAHPRGLFLRVGDDKARVACIFRAVAVLVSPLIIESTRPSSTPRSGVLIGTSAPVLGFEQAMADNEDTRLTHDDTISDLRRLIRACCVSEDVVGAAEITKAYCLALNASADTSTREKPKRKLGGDNSRGVKQAAMDWFHAHPHATARVADLVQDGVSKSPEVLRPTIHRLWKAKFLDRVGLGQFRLANSQA